LAHRRRQTPVSWGFEKSHALLGGGGDHFGRNGATAYVEDDHYVTPNTTNFFSSDFYTSTIIKYIDSSTGKNADGKPFFAYLTYQAPHSPLQAPAGYIDRYKGVYDAGYEPIRAARLAWQKALGLIRPTSRPIPVVMKHSPSRRPRRTGARLRRRTSAPRAASRKAV
jgi:arylsulfatase